MAKQVRETTAGRSVSAYVVLNKKGEHVATINAHYASGGTVSVDVWNHGNAPARCWSAALACGALSEKAAEKAREDVRRARDWVPADSVDEWAAHDMFGLQQSRAGGYGYDKFTAALAGLWIDGHSMADHCGTVREDEKKRARLFREYVRAHDSGASDRREWDQKAERIGCQFANYSTEAGRYMSLNFRAGLTRLADLGYKVIQAI